MEEYPLLSHIMSPYDVGKLTEEQLENLCGEIRFFLIRSLSLTGGHLASNLGIVEIATAIDSVFQSPKDKIIYDVGHQCYVHKLLTGRMNQFASLRQLDGLSGFPRPWESPHDAQNVFGYGIPGEISGTAWNRSILYKNRFDYCFDFCGNSFCCKSYTAGFGEA